jgi:hypothetical protein
MNAVYMLVATLTLPGIPNDVRVVPADRPFFRTLKDCQRAVATLRDSPAYVVTMACERRSISPEGFAR